MEFSDAQLRVRKGAFKAGLVGCGGLALLGILGFSLWGGGVDEAVPAPGTFQIRQVDLWKNPPRDFCRAEDPDFIAKLMSRIGSILPPESSGSLKFEDFNVTDAGTAVLRFKARQGARDSAMMTAAGPFTRKGCSVGKLTLHAGATPLDPAIYSEK